MSNPTPFLKFACLCEELEQTSSKTEKAKLVSQFLTGLATDEVPQATLFIMGRVFPSTDPRTLDVSWRTIQKVTSPPDNKIAPTEPLTILEVQEYFAQIAGAVGKGSRRRRENLLAELFRRATALEEKFLVKITFGEMQHGVGEGVVMQAIAQAVGTNLELVRRASMFSGDLGEVARLGITAGKEALANVGLQLFHPIQPMLAELAKDLSQAFTEHGGRTALEFKFDGARVQIHKQGDEVKIYSRQLSDVTASLPDIVALVQQRIQANAAILEGEVIAVGTDHRPLPFQELMRRFRRVHEVEKILQEVPARLYLFDLLFLEGNSLIDTSYAERWNLLSQVCETDLRANRLVTARLDEADRFLQEAMNQGHEGLMAKALDSNYTPGARGKKWFKIKPAEHLDLVIVAADWGYGRRTGWLSNYHLAAREEDSGDFMVIGKTFKGLTDEEFTAMTRRLQGLKVGASDYTVFVKPEVVVEVAYNEIQRSPRYQSGYALRFARITRIREDKSPQEADTISRVGELYELQFQRKGRAKTQ